MTDPPAFFARPCHSWRVPGGSWSLHEDGLGERLRISNHIRRVDLDSLDDRDLAILHRLIGTAIAFRRQHPFQQGSSAER